MSLNSFLTDVANAIRSKKGTTEKINAQDFPKEIENLPSGGVNEEEIYGILLKKSYGGAIEFLSNFVLADSSVFYTKNDDIFIVKEE